MEASRNVSLVDPPSCKGHEMSSKKNVWGEGGVRVRVRVRAIEPLVPE